jgi:hypothetical protein
MPSDILSNEVASMHYEHFYAFLLVSELMVGHCNEECVSSVVHNSCPCLGME